MPTGLYGQRAAQDGANVCLVAKTAEPHPKLEGTVYTAAEQIEEAGGTAWEPQNYDGSASGPVRMRTALTKSLNLVSVRILQGIGAAMMMPVGRLAIIRTFPKAELLSAMNFVIIPALIGPLLGPTVGGLIVHWMSWREIFFINVPVGLAAIWLAHKYMPDYRGEQARPLDVIGLILFGTGVGTAVGGAACSAAIVLPAWAPAGTGGVGASVLPVPGTKATGGAKRSGPARSTWTPS